MFSGALFHQINQRKIIKEALTIINQLIDEERSGRKKGAGFFDSLKNKFNELVNKIKINPYGLGYSTWPLPLPLPAEVYSDYHILIYNIIEWTLSLFNININ